MPAAGDGAQRLRGNQAQAVDAERAFGDATLEKRHDVPLAQKQSDQSLGVAGVVVMHTQLARVAKVATRAHALEMAGFIEVLETDAGLQVALETLARVDAIVECQVRLPRARRRRPVIVVGG